MWIGLITAYDVPEQRTGWKHPSSCCTQGTRGSELRNVPMGRAAGCCRSSSQWHPSFFVFNAVTPSSTQTVIIFTLQHRNPYPFADQFSSTTALLLLTKALQIDSHTFITQLGAPASNTPGLCITIVTVFPGNISLCGEGCLCSTEPWLWAGWQSLPHPSPHTQAQHIAPLDSHSSCHGGIRWCEQLICSSQYPQQQHNCTKTSATAMAETSSPRGAERRHSGQTRSMNGKALPR